MSINYHMYIKHYTVPDAVLEAVVGCSREDEVGPSKLLDVP